MKDISDFVAVSGKMSEQYWPSPRAVRAVGGQRLLYPRSNRCSHPQRGGIAAAIPLHPKAAGRGWYPSGGHTETAKSVLWMAIPDGAGVKHLRLVSIKQCSLSEGNTGLRRLIADLGRSRGVCSSATEAQGRAVGIARPRSGPTRALCCSFQRVGLLRSCIKIYGRCYADRRQTLSTVR